MKIIKKFYPNAYLLILFICIIFGNKGLAQQISSNTTSEIVMTKVQLDSLLTLVANKKRALLRQSLQLNTNAQQTNRISIQQNSILLPVLTELKNLSHRIDSLSLAVNKINKPVEKFTQNTLIDSSLIAKASIVDSVSKTSNFQIPQSLGNANAQLQNKPSTVHTFSTNPPNSNLEKSKIANETQSNTFVGVAAISGNENKPKKVVADSVENIKSLKKAVGLNSKKDKLKLIIPDDRRLAGVQLANNDVVKENTLQTTTQLLLSNDNFSSKEIKRYTYKIYFANNSTQLTKDELNTLNEIYQIIYKKDKSDLMIYINGYASEVGAKRYNHYISKQRADVIRNYLLKIGVSAQYLKIIANGVDYNSSSDQNARRAVLTIYVDK